MINYLIRINAQFIIIQKDPQQNLKYDSRPPLLTVGAGLAETTLRDSTSTVCPLADTYKLDGRKEN